MSKPIKWIFNRAAVKGISMEPGTTAWLKDVARACAARAQATAPRRSGHYASSFRYGAQPGEAWYGNTAVYALDVEYGAGPNPGYRTMTAAGKATGARLEGLR